MILKILKPTFEFYHYPSSNKDKITLRYDRKKPYDVTLVRHSGRPNYCGSTHSSSLKEGGKQAIPIYGPIPKEWYDIKRND